MARQLGGFSRQRLTRLTVGMEAAVDRGDVAGVVTLIHRRGAEAHCDVVGWQNDESAMPMRRSTLFRIASLTKPVTSVAALMLLEEGKLRLDDRIERWLPEFADRTVMRDPSGSLDDVVPADRSITVLDLLTHRPGIVSHFSATGPIAAEVNALKISKGNGLLLDATDPDEWLARLAALPLAFQPGAKVNYGFATDVLGFLVARASGMPFDRFLAERLFGPLGMIDTAFHVPEAKRDRLALGHAIDLVTGKRVVLDRPESTAWGTPPGAPSGSAGLVSTADDYLKFGRMLLQGGMFGAGRILSRKTIELMTTDFLSPEQRATPFFDYDMWGARGFGLGVYIFDRLGAQHGLGSIGRYGWGGAFGTIWSNDPREDMVMIMMIQLMGGTVGSSLEQDFVNLVYQAIDD